LEVSGSASDNQAPNRSCGWRIAGYFHNPSKRRPATRV